MKKVMDEMPDEQMDDTTGEAKDESTIIAEAQPQIADMANKGDIANNAMPVDSGSMVLDLDQFDMLVEEETGDDVIFVGHGIVSNMDGQTVTIDLRNASIIHGKDWVKADMHKWKEGTLKSGSGQKVTSQKQAVAISLSQARKHAKK